MSDDLEKDVTGIEEIGPTEQLRAKKTASWLRTLGPGLVTGAADDDPSGIATYSIAGAVGGYSMLWLVLITTPMMTVIQSMCARISMVSGLGLAATIRKSTPGWLAYTLAVATIFANTLNIGADLAGMAASGQLILGGQAIVWVLVFAIITYVGTAYCGYRLFANVLRFFCLSLLAYVVTAFIIQPPWATVIQHTVVPSFVLENHWIATVVALLGTTITPYLFYWQAALEVQEEKELGRLTVSARRGATLGEIRLMRADTIVGMVASNLVAFFIIVTTATVLAAHGKHDIATAQDAALALRPVGGQFAYALFAAGIIGTGLLAIPTLAGSSAFIAAETFGFRYGLNEKPNQSPRFYAVFAAGLGIGTVMTLVHVDPIGALYWSAIINAFVAVPLLIVITWIANRNSIMGRWRNTRTANVVSVLAIALMGVAAVSMFIFQ